MSLINCPNCNHTVSDKSKKCIQCGHKIKKTQINKKRIITLVSSFSGLIVLLFVISFITSQVSIKQYFSLISEKNFSCIVGKHNWESATCNSPKYCSICNSKKGKPIEHLWKEADCINPKVCLYCKKTEGEPLEHTVNIGYCNRCNKFVNKYDIEFTVIKESISCLEKSYDKISEFFSKSSNFTTTELYYCELAQAEALNIKKASCIARDICGDIQEFATLKESFSKIDSALYGQIDTKLTLDNYVSYANTLSKILVNSIEAYNEAINEINKINKG